MLARAGWGQRAEALFCEALFAYGRGERKQARQLLAVVVAGGLPTFDEFLHGAPLADD